MNKYKQYHIQNISLDDINHLEKEYLSQASNSNLKKAEIATDNYFHTVLEAMKSVTAKIRTLTGIYTDGAELIDNTLLGKNRCLAINSLKTDSERGEQTGFGNLLKGLYGTFRNPTAHEPKIEWQVSEEDALDVLSVLSYVHRKLDKAYRI